MPPEFPAAIPATEAADLGFSCCFDPTLPPLPPTPPTTPFLFRKLAWLKELREDDPGDGEEDVGEGTPPLLCVESGRGTDDIGKDPVYGVGTEVAV